MLKSIILKNWRSHKDTHLDFGSGTNIIIGRMGGGKSSIIDAICFALFGTCPAVQHRRLKIADYIRSRPDPQKEAEVTLVFKLKDDEYEVRRKVKQVGTSEAELKRNGKMIEGPQAQRVTEHIESLLELDYDLFTRAVYSEQNRIDYFLTLPKGDRKRQIDELLGLTRFEEVRKNATTAASRLRDIVSDREILLKSFEPEKLRSEITSLEQEIEATRQKTNETNEKLSTVSRKKSELQKKFEELTKRRDNYRKLSERKAGIVHTLDVLQKELAAAKFDESELEQMKAELERTKSRKDDTQKKLTESEKNFTTVSKRHAELERMAIDIHDRIKKKAELSASLKAILNGVALEELVRKSESVDSAIRNASDDLAGKRIVLKDLDKALAELERDLGKCPVCDSDLTPEKRTKLSDEKKKQKQETAVVITEREKEVQKFNNELRELKDKVKRAEGYSSRLKEFEGVEEKVSSVENEKKTITTDLDRVRIEKEQLSKDREKVLDEFTERSKRIAQLNEIALKKKKSEELSAESKIVEEEIAELNFDEKSWSTSNEDLNTAKMEELETSNKLKMLQQNAAHLAEKMTDRKKKILDLERYRQEVTNFSTEIEKLQIFSNTLVETQQAMREELVSAANEALGEVWKVVYPYADYPLIQIKPSEDDYDLSFGIGEDEWISVDGIASGGERALACLALRAAFAMVLTPNLSWLILDEPTHNLDEDAVRTLATALHDHIPNIVEQIFVITHDENLRDAASGKLIKVQRSPDAPEISVAEVIS